MKQGIIICFFAMLFCGCAKEQLADGNNPNIIRVQVSGSTSDTLELVRDGKVVAQIKAGSISQELVLGLNSDSDTMQLRKKGTSIVLDTKVFSSQPFKQNMSVLFDGVDFYNKTITVNFIGFLEATVLEFVFKGNVLASGTNAFSYSGVQVPIKEGMTQIIDVRKQGETTVIGTLKVTSSPNPQVLNIYYDGTRIVETYPLPAPANPANMHVITKFKTTIPAQHNGPVDMLFYQYTTDITTATVIMPEIRIAIQETFGAGFELPPLANANSKYAYKLVKRGTTEMPYTFLETDLAPFKPYNAVPFEFTAGSSQLWPVLDRKDRRAAGSTKGTSFTVYHADVSKYINK